MLTMDERAWCVLWINTETKQVEHAGIYSEPSPTTTRPYHPVVLFMGYGATFALARRDAIERLDSPWFAWAKPLMQESHLR